MRKEYEMTQEQFVKILNSCKPVPLAALNCGMPSSPQENANRAWNLLGQEMGFDGMTVQPIPGKDEKYFTAEEIINEKR